MIRLSSATPLGLARKRLAQAPWQLGAGAVIVLVILAAGLAAPLLSPHDPLQEWHFRWFGDRYLPAPFPPSDLYPLGSDQLGRDLWTNLVYGARLTLSIAALVLAARLGVGVVLGGVAGWFARRWPDRLISVLIDAFAAFPTLLFALLWILAFDIRSGGQAFVLALAITGWWAFGRTMRSGLLAIRGSAYLEAASSLGLSPFAVFVRHALPNLLPLLAVAAALETSAVLLALGELGFLGFFVGGGQSISVDDTGNTRFIFFPGAPEWGGLVAQGRLQFLNRPWLALYPALAFGLAILGFNLLGHGLRILLERSPIGLAWLFRWRIAGALAAVALAMRLVLPNVGPAAAYAPLADEFDGEVARAHLTYLADPARGGRLTGSPGYLEAATYVADRFRELGLLPAGDGGTYFQRFETSVVELGSTPEFELIAPERQRFVPRADFSELVGGRRAGGLVEGTVVYVGAGVHTREYSDYRDVDVRGKIVLIAGPTRGDPLEAALRLGAAGALFVARGDGPLLRYSYIPVFEKDTLPTAVVTERVADRLIASSGKRIAELRQILEDRQRREQTRPSLKNELPQPISFETDSRARLMIDLGPVRTVEGINVVGLLPSPRPSDPERYVLVGGHLDGIGSEPDGTAYEAANDNASGPAVTIELARVLTGQRDRLRNGIVFVAFAGEEEGLRGSEQFVQKTLNSSFRPQNLIAYLNLDVVGCCGGTLAASEESFALHARLAAAAERHGIPFTFTRGSSDHQTFIRRSVPAVIFNWADIGPIHTLRDTLEAIDAEHLRRIGIVAAQAILELAAGE